MDTDNTERYESVNRCMISLVHAVKCRDAGCTTTSCHKMKQVVQHTRNCKKRVDSSCPVCKQLIALCCYHAKFCSNANCQVPFCANIRQKMAAKVGQEAAIDGDHIDDELIKAVAAMNIIDDLPV